MKIDNITSIERSWCYTKVLENSEALVVYDCREGSYMAIEKKVKGNGYGISPYYHNAVMGDFKKCKRYFEKYSPETMKALKG